MSGTSLDGIDAALLETDGYSLVRPLGFVCLPYQADIRAQTRACFGLRDVEAAQVKDTAKALTIEHANAVYELLEETGFKPGDIDLIGFHGQTIFHAPREGVTIQIGEGDLLAAQTGIDVVDDFRSADVAAGGEGAPLVPLYHRARLSSDDVKGPVVVLNIGGVGNVTWIGAGEDEILAFDTGPGNALMDDWAQTRTGVRYDEDGMLASLGRPLERYLQEWLSHPYFERMAPKSLDRDQWDIAALGPMVEGLGALSTQDGAATLMEFTARSIVRSVQLMPSSPHVWYVCGGGRHNKALMKRLAFLLSESNYGELKMVEDLGWNGDATEAECFAYLGVRSVLGLPLSLPSTTGVKAPQTGGVFHATPEHLKKKA
jgi:anhydro-N-acetylmuramic acid kinase